jgi:hypothetical protein
MYAHGELRGIVLNRAVVETLESRRLLSVTADELVEGEPIADDSEIIFVGVGHEDDVIQADIDLDYSILMAESGLVDGEAVDEEPVDGEVVITMLPDDGSQPCPEETDENGDPYYCILESNAGTPAPPPTLTDGILNVTGSSGDDKIRISIGKDSSKLAVKVNGAVTLFSLASVTKIKVDGLAGDDDICIKQKRGGIDIATELAGGDGDDKIRGGDGNDLISGGAGKDKLRGNAGDDVLNGGDGADKLFGGRGDDSVIGGDGKDKVRGGGGGDVLDGSRGKDKVRGGAGTDNCLDSDDMLDSNKKEKAQRYAAPMWWTAEEGSLDDMPWWDDTIGDDTGGDAMMPIWWDPENPDAQPPVDTGVEEIVIDDGSGEVPSDSPEDLIMY